MKTLLLKLFRDIKTSISGFISIIFVIGIGAAFFSGLSNSVKSLDVLINNYYEKQNFMDYIAYFSMINYEDISPSIEKNNINNFELRHTFDTVYNVNNKDTDLRIHTITNKINLPYLYKGELPEFNEIVLDKKYMEINNLNIGDIIKIDYNSLNFDLTISGIIDSPEYIYKVKDRFSMGFNFSKFGIGFVNEETLKYKFDEDNQIFFYTDLLIKSNDDLSKLDLFNDVDTFISMVSRDENISYKAFNSALDQISTVVKVFPIIFFIVAGIITFISMSKTVEIQRTQIGIMRVLGFSSFRIYFNYSMYSFISTLIGALVGGFVGIYTIPEIIIETFSTQYVFPIVGLKLYYEFIFYAMIISFIFSFTATIISCYSILKEVPASILRPKPPKKSSHIFIEKFKIWKKMSFIYKIIIRNIFYNKMRLILSSIGVIGSIMFLITGFSLKYSVKGVLDYEARFRKYDFEIRTVDFVDEEKIKSLHENIDLVDLSMNLFGKIYLENFENIEIPIIVIKDNNSLIVLEDLEDNPISFSKDSVIIPNEFLKDYDLNVGNKINMDLSFNGVKNIDVTVTNVANMYSNQAIYISESVLKDKGIDMFFKFAYVKAEDNSNITQMVEELNKNESVEGITLIDEVQGFSKNIMSMINSVILIITIGAAILAISVIYNITSINIFERMREIATLLVLGYYDGEINKLIFIENIILTIFGGILGIPFGIWFSKYMIKLVAERGVLLSDRISFSSIFISFILILIFSSITNFFLKRKVLKVNMVEALKAVD